MQNEIAKYTPTQQQIQGWINLAAAKNKLVDDLTRLQLAAQGVILKPAGSITEREQQLKDYRAAYKAIQDARLGSDVVKRLNELLESFMQYEKAQDPKSNERYKALEQELLNLKKEEQAKAEQAQAKNREMAAYRAHIETSITNMITGFKAAAWREIGVMYEQALQTGDMALEAATIATITSMQLPTPVKYTRVLVSDAEAAEIASKFPRPDIAKLREEMVAECRKMFINLESDIAAKMNTGKVIAEQQAQAVEKEAEQTNFIAAISAEVEVPQIVPEGKQLKKKLAITIEETPEFMIAVLTQFLKIPNATTLLRTRSKFSSTTVAQMAGAIEKYCNDKQITALPGLKITEEVSL